MKENVRSKGETRKSLKSPPGKNIRAKHDFILPSWLHDTLQYLGWVHVEVKKLVI